MILFIRQILFNIVFYGFTALACIVLTPLIILPRPVFMPFLNGYFKMVHVIEKYVLGLDFEVRGMEHIPAQKSFLVAAKHYSAYETMKLHLLFRDPAIILKKELSYIPLWGWLAAKAAMIFVDRSSRDGAVTSIIEGAKRVKREGRPIVIFPQGTRVALTDTRDQKPYKGGIIRMYEAAELPILPLAMNSGVFWKRNAFFKYPGKVIFQFLPPIPVGENGNDVLKKLAQIIDDESARLVAESTPS